MQERFSKKNKKALVLCSSGLDSVYNLLKAYTEFEYTEVIFIDYFQKAVSQEYVHVKKLCEHLNINFFKVTLSWYQDIYSTLIQADTDIIRHNSLNDFEKQKMPSEWVPNRNAVLVNIAGAYAESKKINKIIIGLNKEEAERYPDNTQEFINRVNKLLELSTLFNPVLFSYSIDMDKQQIYLELKELMKLYNLSLDFLWSCYDSYAKMCGLCESCLRLKRVFNNNEEEFKWKELFLQ